MRIVDKFISSYIAMLRSIGIIKNPLRWSRFLMILAALHYILASIVIVLLPAFPPGARLNELLIALAFGWVGYVWHRMSKALRSH
jgi:hypothetical protein